MSTIIYLNKVKLDSNLPAVNFSLGNAYGLAQAGAECHLIAQKSKVEFDKYSLLKAFNLAPIDNFILHIYAEQRKFGIKTNQWFYFKALNEIKKLHKNKKIQAIISRDPGALPYLARMKKKLGIPVFYQPHNFYVDLSFRPEVNSRNAKKYHWLESKFIRKMTAVLCIQESQAEWFEKYFPDQEILVSKPGLFSINYSNSNRFLHRVIGYIGSMKMIKGVDIVLDAMPVLSAKGFRLLLIGGRNKDEIHRVEEKIAQLKIKDSVEITGWLPYSQVENYMDQISVGVIPLVDNFYNRYLTAPNKLFDYISRGIPIVAADLPSIKDFLTNRREGIFFKPDSKEDFIAVILELFSSTKFYNELQQNSFRSAEKYLWSKCGENMIRQIESIIQS